MKVLRSITIVWLVTLLFARPTPAQTDGDPAAAELLFQKGRKAMEQGAFDRACAYFHESYKFDEAVGTVMNLATCEEKRGRLASAWERWQQAIRLLERDDARYSFATERVASLESDVPRLRIVLSEDAPSDTSVHLAGVLLGTPSLGEPLPVNPGSHQILVKSPGYHDRTFSADLAPGQEQTIDVRPGAKLPPTALDGGGGQDRSVAVHRTSAYVSSAIGVLGLGSAAVTGALLPGTQAVVDDNCSADGCNEEGNRAKKRGRGLLVANTVSWIAGSLGAVTGTILFLTIPGRGERQTSAALNASPTGLSLNVRGSF